MGPPLPYSTVSGTVGAVQTDLDSQSANGSIVWDIVTTKYRAGFVILLRMSLSPELAVPAGTCAGTGVEGSVTDGNDWAGTGGVAIGLVVGSIVVVVVDGVVG